MEIDKLARSSGSRLAVSADGSRFDHELVKEHTYDELLSQFKIIENRWITERD